MKLLHDNADEAPDLAALVDQVHEFAIRLVGAMDVGLAQRGLSRARAEVVLVIGQEGPMTQRRLSELLRCSPRNVTGLLDGLASAGLVERRPHATDRRAVTVGLTASGTVLAVRLRTEQARAGTELFAGIAPAELTTFRGVLDQILDRLDTGTTR